MEKKGEDISDYGKERKRSAIGKIRSSNRRDAISTGEIAILWRMSYATSMYARRASV